MSFVAAFNELPLASLLERIRGAGDNDVRRALHSQAPALERFATLLAPAGAQQLEALGAHSQALTRQRFGKVIRLFAPIYLSNECINNCAYCGFSRDNPILRVTLTPEEVQCEARALRAEGFRHLLLVAGEHPKFVGHGYLADCLQRLHPEFPSLALEIGPMETADYLPLVQAGAEGLVVYQETYDRAVYARLHTAGPKRNFDWRLETPERAHAAGFRRIGIGALLGLADWRSEALALAAHTDYLLRHCWKAQITVSLPRLRPCAGEFQPLTHVTDRDLVQLVCAFRIAFPDVGLVLSTREAPRLRDGLIPLGITLMSAGSHTEPGGYTGAGRQNLHQTQRGRIVPVADPSSEWLAATDRTATRQFDVADDRPAAVVAGVIHRLGYEPVWKDWDAALSKP